MNSTRSLTIGAFLLYAFLAPATAQAQYNATPFQDLATGEGYHVEAAMELWNPPLNLIVASERFGLVGTQIDASQDLGLQNKTIMDLRFVVRPAKKHKFRLSYLPMRYSGQSTLHREFVFNGQRFGVNLPISTELEWTTWLLAYEYDFLYRDNWFVGMTLNTKFTKTNVTIDSPVANEFAEAKAPVPTIGGIGRVYVMPNIAVTGELNLIRIPNSISQDYRAHYVDFDINGTVNFNNYVGAQVGYRRIDVLYRFKKDDGTLLMKGLYFGGVVRY